MKFSFTTVANTVPAPRDSKKQTIFDPKTMPAGQKT